MTDIKLVKPVLKPAIVFISRLDPSTKKKKLKSLLKTNLMDYQK